MIKIFLSRNLSLNMPKNVLFLLKNCKNRQTLWVLPTGPLASGGRLGAPPPGPHISHPAF